MCFSIEINSNFLNIKEKFNTSIYDPSYENMNKLIESSHQDAKQLKIWDEENRIFPNSFAPVIAQNKSEKNLFFMRYRLRPHDSKKELPSKFKLYNARLESVEEKSTWSGLFMRKHGVVLAKSFFEWVKDDKGLSKLVKFSDTKNENMNLACLFDNWISDDQQVKFSSFAVLTTEAPVEILEKGHDRCPVNLSDSDIDSWLNPRASTKKRIHSVLNKKKDTQYKCLNIY